MPGKPKTMAPFQSYTQYHLAIGMSLSAHGWLRYHLRSLAPPEQP